MNKFSDLLVRAVAAIIGLVILVFCIMFGPWTFFAVFFLITMLCIREFVRLGELPVPQVFWLFITSAITFTMLSLIAMGNMQTKWLIVMVPAMLIGLIIQLYVPSARPIRNMAVMFLGIGYVVIPVSMLSFIVFYQGVFTPILVVGLFTLIWCQDTGAYFFGSAFGKHKLFERISPKKSWEGAIGGFIITMIGAFAMSQVFEDLSVIQWLISGLVISISGIFGDLVESFMKRVAMAKDSGRGIPGHGGFLDRFDSLLFSAPFFLLLLLIFDLL
ncbi:MAG: phosphatidate cytidylyltransferase [Cyclobacteriaceae bacterium]